MPFSLFSSKFIWKTVVLGTLSLLILFTACKTDTTPSTIPSKRAAINEVIVRLNAQPKKLNPLITGATAASQIEEHLFDYLLVFDDEDFSLQPELAKARPLTEPISEGIYKGGIAYTYEIEPAATWDNGTPITAKDVLFTLKAINNPLVNAQGYRSYISFFKDVRLYPDNPKKITILANKKYILGEAASAFFILPEYHYDSLGLMKDYALKDLTNPKNIDQLKQDDNIKAFAEWINSPEANTNITNISGSGPYKIKKWVSNQELVLERKKNWWGDKIEHLEAHPDKIIYRFIPETNTAVTLLKDEGIDVLSKIPFIDFEAMKADERMSGLYDFFTTPTLSYSYIGLNNQGTFLKDKKVRRALAHLMDVEQLIETVEGGYAERITGPIHPSKTYYNRDLKAIEYDLSKAQSLLAEAGWKDSDGDGILDKKINGQQTAFSLKINHIPGDESRKNTALIFQEGLKKAGIQLEIEALELGTLIQKLYAKDYDMTILSWNQQPSLKDLYQIWHSDSDIVNGGNIVGFRNAEADALIEAIRNHTEMEKLLPLYQKVQAIIYEEQPYIFLYSPINKLAIHKRFNAKASIVRPGYFENTFQLKTNQ